MQLNKKIIYITILLAFAIVFFYTSNVFATENQYHENDLYNSIISYGINEDKSSIGSNLNDYILFKVNNSDTQAYVIYFYNKSTHTFVLNDNGTFTVENIKSSSVHRLAYKYFDSNGNSVSDWYSNYATNAGSTKVLAHTLEDGLVTSRQLYDVNGGEVFFPRPVVETTIIAPLLEKEKMEVTMMEILGIIPIAMTILVSYLALRKALQVLGNFLKLSLIHI